MFWAGLAVSLGIVGWNQYIAGRVPGIKGIPLKWYWGPFIEGSILDGLRPWTRFHIIFTLIGLTFLIPSRISYSLWSFHVLYMLQLLIIVWLGYGVNEGSFPADWYTGLNFRTAEGGGALIVFAAVILWKCRKYIFCGFRPGAVAELEKPERRELRVASWLFVLGSAALVLILNQGMGANIFHCILYYLLMLVVTIGLIRAVAEGGFLALRCYFGPFHVIRSVFGMNHTWSLPTLLVPLFIFHSAMFWSYRTFIAPAMANALKIRDKLRMRRLGFHGAVAAAIVCALAVGLLAHIVTSYSVSADGMNYWFYRHVPLNIFTNLKNFGIQKPVDVASGKWWMLAGGLAMVALLYFRRHVFWLPHPIWLIMFVNPIMNAYWFSILIGWIFKSLVSKYGNKDVYARFRCFFIGLIIGEVVLKGLSGLPLDDVWLWER